MPDPDPEVVAKRSDRRRAPRIPDQPVSLERAPGPVASCERAPYEGGVEMEIVVFRALEEVSFGKRPDRRDPLGQAIVVRGRLTELPDVHAVNPQAQGVLQARRQSHE